MKNAFSRIISRLDTDEKESLSWTWGYVRRKLKAEKQREQGWKKKREPKPEKDT
jgi:hypothetical protein